MTPRALCLLESEAVPLGIEIDIQKAKFFEAIRAADSMNQNSSKLAILEEPFSSQDLCSCHWRGHDDSGSSGANYVNRPEAISEGFQAWER